MSFRMHMCAYAMHNTIVVVVVVVIIIIIITTTITITITITIIIFVTILDRERRAPGRQCGCEGEPNLCRWPQTF
jgi:hypothetical protein